MPGPPEILHHARSQRFYVMQKGKRFQKVGSNMPNIYWLFRKLHSNYFGAKQFYIFASMHVVK